MKKIVLMMLLMLPVAGWAQGDDWGMWLSLGADKKVTKKFSYGVEAEIRTRDNFTTMDRLSIGVDADYKLAKWLKLSAGYSLLYNPNFERMTYYDENDDEVALQEIVDAGDPKRYVKYDIARHRFNVSMTGDVNIGHFNVSLRERWQYTYRPEKTVDQRYDYYEEAWDGTPHTYRGKGKNVLRSRLQIEYKKKGLKVTPYANAELFNAWGLQKSRYTVGLDWKMDKQNVFGLAYRYQYVHDDDDDYDPNMHFVGVSYKRKF